MSENSNNQRMPFSAKNYALMAVGVLVIVVGFILMSGGGEHTATEFDSSIYSTRRITIAPIVVIVGFVIEIFAIMLRFNPKNRE
jgi:TRAP-type C4-dicarboxylate transport system permease small subunit